MNTYLSSNLLSVLLPLDAESIQELWNTEYLKSADSVFEALFVRKMGEKQQSK
jgi:hypothetical protein